MGATATTIGLNCKLYRSTGSWNSPVWVEIPTVKDLKIPLTKTEVDASSRVSSWKKFLGALKEGGIEYEIVRDNTRSEYGALRDSYTNSTVITMAIADQVITNSGCEYLKMDVEVFDFSGSQPLEGVVAQSVKQKPSAQSANDPVFVTVP